MYKITILVATHKETSVYSDDIYTPIQVGKALSNIDLGFLSDNTGDNISNKNSSYCELTAQYWAWKNLHVDYIGLCHYRRYFDIDFSDYNINEIFSHYDILLPLPLYFDCSIHEFWMSSLIPEDVAILYEVFKSKYPQMYDDFKDFMLKNKFFPFNMFVCRKNLFDDFAQWQFPLLGEVEKMIPKSPYSRERRLLGFLGEGLLTFYCQYHHLRIKQCQVVKMLGDNKIECLAKQSFRSKLGNTLKWALHRKKNIEIPNAIIHGLKNDGFLQ